MNEAKKVIYIFERRHHYNYDGKMFFLDQIKEAGYTIEVWSLVNWTFGEGLEEPLNIDISGRGVYINNKKEFNEQISRIRDERCVFVCYPYHAYTNVAAYVRKKIVMSGFHFCNLCESPKFINYKSDIKDNKLFLVLIEELRYLAYYVKCKIINKEVFFKEHFYPFKYKSDFNILSTEENFKGFPNKLEIFSNRNVIVHSDDYDNIFDMDIFSEENHIVFVDQYLTGHSDFIKLGMEYPISDKEEYFKECCQFFDKLEKKWECKVVIAAHPKAEYNGEEFGGRKILRGKTGEVIKTAKLVLIATSKMYGMTCFLNKSFLIISSRQMINGIMWQELSQYSKYFGKQICVMSECKTYNDIEECIVKPNYCYQKLVKRVVISPNGIGDKRFSEVMLEILKKMFG